MRVEIVYQMAVLIVASVNQHPIVCQVKSLLCACLLFGTHDSQIIARVIIRTEDTVMLGEKGFRIYFRDGDKLVCHESQIKDGIGIPHASETGSLSRHENKLPITLDKPRREIQSTAGNGKDP